MNQIELKQLKQRELNSRFNRFLISFYYSLSENNEIEKRSRLNLERFVEHKSGTTVQKILEDAINNVPNSSENNFFEKYIDAAIFDSSLPKKEVKRAIMIAEREAGMGLEQMLKIQQELNEEQEESSFN